MAYNEHIMIPLDYTVKYSSLRNEYKNELNLIPKIMNVTNDFNDIKSYKKMLVIGTYQGHFLAVKTDCQILLEESFCVQPFIFAIPLDF